MPGSKKKSKVKAPAAPAIVALSPKTGKPLKKPRSGEKVFFGVTSGRGKVRKIPSEYPQAYSAKDKAALQKILDKSGDKNFVVYERRTTEVLKDAAGKVRYRDDKKTGKKVALRKTKITGHSGKIKERPILVKKEKGRYSQKKTDYIYKRRSKREIVDDKLLRVLSMQPPEKPVLTKEIFLTGPSIFANMKNVKLAVTGAQLKRIKADAVYVEGTLRGYEGHSRIFALNFTSAFRDKYPDLSHTLPIVRKLSDFPKQVSKLIRYKLADVGYRFTSLFDLQEYQDEINERAEDEGETPGSIFYYNANKSVLDVEAVVPESEATFEEGYGLNDTLGTDRRLLKGGRRLSTPEKSKIKVSVSLRITAYRDPVKRQKREKLHRGKRRKS